MNLNIHVRCHYRTPEIVDEVVVMSTVTFPTSYRKTELENCNKIE